MDTLNSHVSSAQAKKGAKQTFEHVLCFMPWRTRELGRWLRQA
jgi:hypothetical protein